MLLVHSDLSCTGCRAQYVLRCTKSGCGMVLLHKIALVVCAIMTLCSLQISCTVKLLHSFCHVAHSSCTALLGFCYSAAVSCQTNGCEMNSGVNDCVVDISQTA